MCVGHTHDVYLHGDLSDDDEWEWGKEVTSGDMSDEDVTIDETTSEYEEVTNDMDTDDAAMFVSPPPLVSSEEWTDTPTPTYTDDVYDWHESELDMDDDAEVEREDTI